MCFRKIGGTSISYTVMYIFIILIRLSTVYVRFMIFVIALNVDRPHERAICIMQVIDSDGHLIPTYNVTFRYSHTSEKKILTHVSIISLMPTINSVHVKLEAVTA